MIKLIASDVDGTLVPDGGSQLNPEYFDVIRALKAQGIIFMAASGRQYVGMSRLFEPVKNEIGFICESGAVIVKDGQYHVPRPIPYEYVREFTEDVSKIPGADLMVSTPEFALCPVSGSRMHKWLVEGYRYDIKALDAWEMPEGYTYAKVSVYFPDRVEEVTRDLVKKWQGRLHMVLAGSMWLDCVMPGVNKGAALRVVQEDLGVDSDETWAFGDNQNDLEMLLDAGGAFAVSTARPEVIAAADHVIANYESDGVLGQLKALLNDK